MTMHMSNSMEIRNFSEDQYYAGQAGQMPGSDNFMAEAVIRILGPAIASEAPPEVIFGNATDSGGGSGWYLVLSNTGDVNGQRMLNITFGMIGSSNLTASANIALGSVLGKTLHLIGLVQTTDAGEGTETDCTLFINGARMATEGDTDWTPIPSAAAPSIGFLDTLGYLPLTSASVLGTGYTELNDATDDYNTLSNAVAQRFLETMKRAQVKLVVSEDLTEDLALSNAYRTYTSGRGVPAVLVNAGTAKPAGDLAKVGAGTTLITVAAYTEWGSPVVVVEAEGA